MSLTGPAQTIAPVLLFPIPQNKENDVNTTGMIMGAGQTIAGSQRELSRAVPSDVARDMGSSHIARSLQELMQISASIEERLTATTDKMLGGIPREAASKTGSVPRRNGGAMGEFEGCLAEVRARLEGINDNLVRLEAFI